MNGESATLLRLAAVFGMLGLMSFGGINTVLPQMHLDVVNNEHWIEDRQFADCYAIAQAAPGPGSLIVVLIGYKAAGFLGALVAALAIVLPPAVLTYLLTRVWERARKAKWRAAVEKGLAPVTVGLLFASSLTIMRAADHKLAAYIVTGVAALIFTFTRINPLIVMVLCGLIGYLGWLE